VQCALLKCYTILQHRDSSVNIPLPPDQHHCSDEAKWRFRSGFWLRATEIKIISEIKTLQSKNK